MLAAGPLPVQGCNDCNFTLELIKICDLFFTNCTEQLGFETIVKPVLQPKCRFMTE